MINFLAVNGVQRSVCVLEKRQVKTCKLDPGLKSTTKLHGLSFFLKFVALRLPPQCIEVQKFQKVGLESVSALCL